MRTLGAVVAMVIPSTIAHAGGGASLPKAVSSACGRRVAGAQKAIALGNHMQEAVYHVWLKKGRALVSVTATDNPCGDGPSCRVIPIGRATGRFTGKVLAGGGQAKAFVVGAVNCGDDSDCASMLAIRPPASDDQILDAISVPGGCEASLSTLSLVPGQDSISLLCTAQAGAGDIESRMIFHIVDGKLTQQLSFDAGATQLASADERAGGACTIRAVGAAVVVKGKDGPRLRITRAPDDGQVTSPDGKGPACSHQMGIEQDYKWDPAARQLVVDGPGRPVVKDVCDCKH
jgi:hypothetical protein